VRGAHYTGDRPTPEQLAQLYDKQSEGEIARQHGVAKSTVASWLEMAGIERRTAKEAAMLRFATQAEFVPSAERDDFLLDRAWEARPGRRIRDKVGCRLCFQQVSRLLGKTAHFSTRHEGMTGGEYARLMPGHRHDCFQHSADSNGLEVEKLMDDWCTLWATANEIRNWRRGPKLAQGGEYVGCLECGRKLFSGAEIQRHLRKIHNWSLEQYRERYPSAPTGSLERRGMQAEKSNKRWYELKDLRAQREADSRKLADTEAKLHDAQVKAAGQPAIIRRAVDEAIETMGEVFALPEIQQKPHLIFDDRWTPAGFSKEEIEAARQALLDNARRSNRVKVAAMHLVATKNQVSFETVRDYCKSR